MDYLPPLRNYQQMVRVVQNDMDGHHLAKHSVNFSLGNAFGGDSNTLFGHDNISPTEQQIRTLDSMNLPSSSPRRAGEIKEGGLYPTRAGSSLFHNLNDSTRDYLNGTGHQVASRHEDGPGTKFRTELSSNADNKVIFKTVHVAQHITHNSDHRAAASHFPAHNPIHSPINAHYEHHHQTPPQRQHTASSHSGLSILNC